jgi:hypothetical protein
MDGLAVLNYVIPTTSRGMRMNRYEGGGEAVIEYLDSNIRVIKPGSYVRCVVTGQAIPLDQLKYWSVERQEAYSSPEAVLKRLGVTPHGHGAAHTG